jgi:ribosomal protein S13
VKFDENSKYRDNKNAHFKSLQTNLQTNLENRLAVVEELKELINLKNIKDTLKHFNELRERWKMQVRFQRTSTTTCGIITIFMLKIL